MTFGKLAPGLHALGYPVIPVEGKRALVEKWPTIAITSDQVAYWAGNGQAGMNVGMRCGDPSVGGVAITLADIDFYDKAVARAVAASIEQTFGATVERRGQAPKRSLVYSQAVVFGKIQQSWTSPDGTVHKMEWLGQGQQFVAFGTHPQTKKPYTYPGQSLDTVEPWELTPVDKEDVQRWMNDVLPTLIPSDWLLARPMSKSSVTQPTAPSDRMLMNYRAPLDVSIEELEAATMLLDADLPHDDWVKVLMALHHQTGGGAEGLALAHKWSSLSPSYKKSEVDAKWRSMRDDPSRGPVTTAASILKAARDIREAAAPKKSLDHRTRIAEAKDELALRDVIMSIRDAGGVDGVDLDLVAGAAAKRMKEITKLTVGIQVMRDALTPEKRVSTGTTDRDDAWCEPYVWVKSDDCYVNKYTQQSLSVLSFNATHGRDVKHVWMTEDMAQMQPHQVATNELQIPVVDGRMYIPWAGEVFDHEGRTFVNKYMAPTVQAVMEADWTDGDREAVEVFRRHIMILADVEKDGLHFINWLAHNVQFPGIKIRHSPILKGMQGDGKTTIGVVLGKVMGDSNVGIVSPKVLQTNFNGWAEGVCVAIMEELKMVGHNRHDILNAMKENHTNETVVVHRKGKDSYNVINTVNILGLTNFNDSVPLDEDDRRHFVMFSPFNHEEDLLAAGLDQAYFDRLYGLAVKHIGAIRGWFLGIDLSGFNRNGRAPDTRAKQMMIAASSNDPEITIREMIYSGHYVGLRKHFVSTQHLKTAITAANFERAQDDQLPVLEGQAMWKFLTKLKFDREPKQHRLDGPASSVWLKGVKGTVNDTTIKKMYEDTKNVEY